MQALKTRTNGNVAAEILKATTAVSAEELEARIDLEKAKKVSQWTIRIGVILAVALLIVLVVWYYTRPVRVVLIHPKQQAITETITSSGRVGGMTETNVGSQSQGVVQTLNVEEGAEVIQGQELAVIKNDVAQAQILQSEAMLNTARTQLELATRGALPSDVDAVFDQVRQAQAQVEQQQAAIVQAQNNVLQARSLLAQFEAERDLARKELARSSSLVKDGVISRSQYDQDATKSRVADKKVTAQQQGIALAQSGVKSAQSGLKSAQANVGTQQARLRTIQSGARPEDIAVANQRVAEAEKALGVAREQAANSVVTAPFAGRVTRINTETGQTVGSTGILTLVSSQLEIRLDVDESNLSSLRVGQKTVITSGTFADSSFAGTVAELGAAVDQTRGTIEIKVVPDQSPEWLRPGLTVDVNIITAENVDRLLVPQTALARSGDETVVLMLVNGKVAQKPVTTRPLTKEGVPVISGLTAEDFIISDAAAVTVGSSAKEQ